MVDPAANCVWCLNPLPEPGKPCPSCEGKEEPKVDFQRFADLAVKKGLVAPRQVSDVQAASSSPEWKGKTIPEILVARGFMSQMDANALLKELTEAPPKGPKPKPPARGGSDAKPQIAALARRSPEARTAPKGSRMVLAGALLGVGAAALGALLLYLYRPRSTPAAHAAAPSPESAPADNPAVVEQAFAVACKAGAEKHLASGEYSAALESLTDLAQRYPQMAEKISKLRTEIESLARSEYSHICRDIEKAHWDRDPRLEELIASVRRRFGSVGDLPKELEAFLGSLGIGRPPKPEAPGPPKENPVEALVAQANRLVDEARSALERSRAGKDFKPLDEAAEKVREATSKYRSAQEGAPENKKEEIARKFSAAVDLTERIRRARSEMAEPPPERKSLEPLIGILSRFVSGELKAADAENLLRGLAAEAVDERLSAAALLFAGVEEAQLGDDEKKALQEYMSAFPLKEFDSADHAKALEHLEAARGKIRAARETAGRGLLAFELAHFARLSKANPQSPAVSPWASKLGLAAADDGYETKAAAAAQRARKAGDGTAEALAEVKKAGPLPDPEFVFFGVYQKLVSFSASPADEKKKHAAETARMLRETRLPERFRKFAQDLGAIVGKSTVCSACKGEHFVKCSSCDKGEAKAVCNQCGGKGGSGVRKCGPCNGTGKASYVSGIGQAFSLETCRTCQGKGTVIDNPCTACGAKGTWKVKCPRCGATGQIECRSCKDPWREPALDKLIELKPCPLCRESGSAFERAHALCPWCAGVGKLMQVKR